jgi:hypothetical protein
MFIFNRSLGTVAAGLTVAVLVVVLERWCAPPQEEPVASVASLPAITCAPPGACGIVRAGS